jgi:dihydroorotase
MTQTITITRPDDWHLHVRDGDAMRCVVPHTARQMGRAIIMPNLKPPVTTAEMARTTAPAFCRPCLQAASSSR